MRSKFDKTCNEVHIEQNPDQRRWLRDHPDGGRWVGVNQWKNTTPFTWQGHWLSILDWNGYEGREYIEVMDPLTTYPEQVDVSIDPNDVKSAVDTVCNRLSRIHYNDLLATNQQLHAWDAWVRRNKEMPTDKARRQMARGMVELYERYEVNLPGDFRHKFAELANELVHECE